MPLVTSHYKLAELYAENESKTVRSNNADLSVLVSAIAIDILTKDPLLVANVAAGKISKRIGDINFTLYRK